MTSFALRSAAFVLAGFGLMAAGRVARAAGGETAHLAYAVDKADACPDEESFRHQVAARIGYDPFVSSDATAKHAVRIALTSKSSRMHARIEIRRDGETETRVRTLEENISQCDALVSAAATTVGMALDPAESQKDHSSATTLPALAPPAQATQPVPAAAPRSSEAEPPRAAIANEPSPPLSFFGSVATIGSLALTPGPALGAQVGFGFRRARFSLEAAGRVETMLSAEPVDAGQRIEATVFSALLLPCAHFGPAFACATGRVGSFQGRSPDVVDARLGTSIFAAGGARAGIVAPLTSALAFRAAGNAELAVVRTSLTLDGRTVWTAPPIGVGLELGLTLSFR